MGQPSPGKVEALAVALLRPYLEGCGATWFPSTAQGANVNIGCLSRGMGKPGFPAPPPAGGPGRLIYLPHPGTPSRPRPREGLALKQGDGETGFPHPPARGRVWEGVAVPRRTYVHPVRVGRSRMDG